MSTYDAVPYPSGPIRPAHPDRLAALAAICGLQPALVERCRVLELGCSDGGNLIPLAELLPESQFVGIDNSPCQIDDGRATIAALGLTNLRLECLDLLQFPVDFGVFDFILCHGVFSWVPPAVQDSILEICGRHLAPHGVAFISYNTYPGWHQRAMIREMMLAHVAEFEDPQLRIDQAQAFLDFLVRFTPDSEQPYARILRGEQARLKLRPRTYLFHEHLESCNSPLYFRDFMHRAAQAGLGYLGDDVLPVAWHGRARPEAVQLMENLGADILRREQYLDFLQGCMFRQSLLTRADAPVNHQPAPDTVRRCWLSAALEPRVDIENLAEHAGVEFHTPDDRSVTLSDPIAKAAVLQLSRIWPQSITYASLLERAATMLYGAGRSSEVESRLDNVLADALLQCVAAGMVHPSLTPHRFVETPSAMPRATGFARLKAAAAAQVTTITHFPIAVPEIHRRILLQLDGTRDVNALAASLVQLVERGELRLESGGGSVSPQERDAALAAVVRESLDYLARTGLLIA